LSILCGEAALIIFYFKWIPSPVFLPVIWVMGVTFAVYLIVHLLMLQKEHKLQISAPQWISNSYFWLFAAIFILAMDFWAWGKMEPTVLGIPLWVGYFVLLSAVQTIVMRQMIKKEN